MSPVRTSQHEGKTHRHLAMHIVYNVLMFKCAYVSLLWYWWLEDNCRQSPRVGLVWFISTFTDGLQLYFFLLLGCWVVVVLKYFPLPFLSYKLPIFFLPMLSENNKCARFNPNTTHYKLKLKLLLKKTHIQIPLSYMYIVNNV